MSANLSIHKPFDAVLPVRPRVNSLEPIHRSAVQVAP
jgi:hypothetical protein